MAAGQADRIVHQLRWLAHGCDERARSDGQLLERFIGRRDEIAFAELLRRHGPMVLGVCRRLLGHAQDAEDAFQATFMVLVRKARSVVPRELVGNWLYGVAYRVALEAQARSGRRRAREKQVEDMPHPTTPAADPTDDLRPLLDRELSRLPEKYRVPIVLCDLEGRTRKDVAGQLGVPEGTVSSRLNTGRKLLAGRLARRGLAVTGAALAAALAGHSAQAAVPGALAIATIKAAAAGAAGQALALGLLSARAAALTEGVMQAMLISKLKSMAAVLVTVGLFAAGAGVMTLSADEPPGSTDVAQATQPAAPAPAPGWAADVLKVVRGPDGTLYLLQADGTVRARELAQEKPPAPAATDRAIEALFESLAKDHAQKMNVNDFLQHVHKYPKWTAWCGSCHQTQLPAAGGGDKAPAKPQLEKGVRDDVIVIRLPKKANPTGDAEFLRRVCLDMVGRTPTLLEMHYFLADKDANKYQTVVEKLLRETPPAPRVVPIWETKPAEPAKTSKAADPVARAEAYVKEKLGERDLSAHQRQIIQRAVEFMQKEYAAPAAEADPLRRWFEEMSRKAVNPAKELPKK